jgi:N-acetylated-alpha-linked acidic dipeptidase
MADADVLPYDYQLYGREIISYIETAQRHASEHKLAINFAPALAAAHRFAEAGTAVRSRQLLPPANTTDLNQALRTAEEDLLNPNGLPRRSWYKHTIYAPGEFTGYAAVVIPGVNEAIDAPDVSRANEQLVILTDALNRAAATLEAASK